MDLKHSRNTAVMVLLILGTVLAASGRIDRMSGYLGLQFLADRNDAYLTESFDKSVNGFLILSAIKSGLAVVEGSEVGVGFNLELGDVVQSVYDYVDVAWKAALAGGTIVLFLRLILQTASMIDHWCLAVTFIAGLITLIIGWGLPARQTAIRLMRGATFYLFVFSAVLYLVLPISITGAALVSRKITRPLIDESHRSFETIKEDFSLDTINRQLMPDADTIPQGWLDDFNISAKYRQVKARLTAFVEYLQEKSRSIAIWTIQLVAGYLFDSIVFPAAVFIIIFVFTKRLLLHLFESRQQQSLRQDLTDALRQVQPLAPGAPPTGRPKRLRDLRRGSRRKAYSNKI